MYGLDDRSAVRWEYSGEKNYQLAKKKTREKTRRLEMEQQVAFLDTSEPFSIAPPLLRTEGPRFT